MTEAAHEIVERQEAAAPASASEGAAIIQVIQRAAADPNVDIEKMERLLQMQERIHERQSKIDYQTAMAAAQREMEPVAARARNQQTNSNYAKLEHIARAIKPIVAQHGFSLSFDEGDTAKAEHLRILCRVMHASGHSETHHMDVPIDLAGLKGNQNKTKTHAFGSTVSYGRRYLTLAIFDIATGDDDDGNAAGRADNSPISADQFQALQNLLEECGRSEEKFCAYYKIAHLHELPTRLYDHARAQILTAAHNARKETAQGQADA